MYTYAQSNSNHVFISEVIMNFVTIHSNIKAEILDSAIQKQNQNAESETEGWHVAFSNFSLLFLNVNYNYFSRAIGLLVWRMFQNW